jgi:hypothetical protein
MLLAVKIWAFAHLHRQWRDSRPSCSSCAFLALGGGSTASRLKTAWRRRCQAGAGEMGCIAAVAVGVVLYAALRVAAACVADRRRADVARKPPRIRVGARRSG